jgi:hypothetical protein
MANKFKKAEEKKKVAPGGGSPAPEVIEPTEVIPTPPPAETPVTLGELLSEKVKAVEKKPEGKSMSLYLTTEALEKLDRFAKAHRCSRSKAADLIFRNLE